MGKSSIRTKVLLCALVIAELLFTGCGSVPLTERRQVLLVSDKEVFEAGLTQYNEYIAEAQLSSDAKATAMVKSVGKRLSEATERYLKANGFESELANLQWEFNLVKNNEVNAFCMPGGKIVVYEGLLKLCSSDDELAVVVGHEVAHAVAKHSNERISQQLLAEYGAQIVGQALSKKSESIQKIGNTVYGLGAQYGVTLPFSRKHESEADYMGLIFMTIAGYNPSTAITFWKKMSASGGAAVPEFMSTHPSDATRINDIKKYLPELEKYKKK